MDRIDKADSVFRNYGWTNDQAKLDMVRAFVAAAIADGWQQGEYFAGESLDSACKLRRDGFTMSVLTRRNESANRWVFTAQVHAWGPDELALDLPDVYPGFEVVQAALLKCSQCKAEGVTTFRFAFAGRCCATCLPMARRKYETPGWAD